MSNIKCDATAFFKTKRCYCTLVLRHRLPVYKELQAPATAPKLLPINIHCLDCGGICRYFRPRAGDMVRAPHDEDHIVKPTIGRDEPMTLSKSSESLAICFLESGLRSWCVLHTFTENWSAPLYFNDGFFCNYITIPITMRGSIAHSTMTKIVLDHSKALLPISNSESHLEVNLTAAAPTDVSSGVKIADL